MTELIDKQYLTDYLRALLYDLKKDEAFNREWIYGIEKAIEIVDRQEVKQQWIPVSERLPESNYLEDVLVTNSEGKVDSCFYSDGIFRSDIGYSYEEGDVVAWMPLPEPYEREEE